MSRFMRPAAFRRIRRTPGATDSDGSSLEIGLPRAFRPCRQACAGSHGRRPANEIRRADDPDRPRRPWRRGGEGTGRAGSWKASSTWPSPFFSLLLSYPLYEQMQKPYHFTVRTRPIMHRNRPHTLELEINLAGQAVLPFRLAEKPVRLTDSEKAAPEVASGCRAEVDVPDQVQHIRRIGCITGPVSNGTHRLFVQNADGMTHARGADRTHA